MAKLQRKIYLELQIFKFSSHASLLEQDQNKPLYHTSLLNLTYIVFQKTFYSVLIRCTVWYEYDST